MREFRKYNVIEVPGEEACYHLYHSGVVDNTGRYGMVIALSEDAQASLLAWVPISSRLANARPKGTTENLTVIAVYVPTLDAGEKTNDSFYDDLQDAVDRVPTGHMLIVAGDWNARPGAVDPATWHILGKFAVGTRCVNDDRLVNFASSNHLVVSSTHFRHPERHLVTWFSNDGRTGNQIDHMLVRSRLVSSVIDCRAYNGAQTDSEHGLDHAMVRAHLLLRMKAARISNRPAKLYTSKLKTVEGLQLNEDASPEDEWRELKDAAAGVSQAHLGKTRRRRRRWDEHLKEPLNHTAPPPPEHRIFTTAYLRGGNIPL